MTDAVAIMEGDIKVAERCANTLRRDPRRCPVSSDDPSVRPRCSIPGCNEPWRTKGFCGAHYQRFRRFGDPLGSAPRPTREERFWAKVEKSEGCWTWAASCYSNGYGRFDYGLAHRIAYELVVGEIPEGLDLDHLCRNRRCVNPAHLEPVTRRENLMRGRTLVAAKAGQTHCKHGHEFTEENTHIRPNGTRSCRECSRIKYRRWWVANRARREAP